VARASPQQRYDLVDPDSQSEAEFEFIVVRALSSLYPDHSCRVFTGSFLHEGQISRPDLMLVAPDFSHWFVIEVELTSHSLHGHVLPQVRALRYGEPQDDCITVLARELAIGEQSARTLLFHVPRTVTVIGNSLDREWVSTLSGVPVQYAAVSVFRSVQGDDILEVHGEVEPIEMSLGFGLYSATDRSLRFSSGIQLPDGLVQISDPSGGAGTWVVRRDGLNAWITKEAGVPSIPDGVHVQLMRALSGRTVLRIPERKAVARLQG
jgi:hypothetical protein